MKLTNTLVKIQLYIICETEASQSKITLNNYQVNQHFKAILKLRTKDIRSVDLYTKNGRIGNTETLNSN